MTDPTEDLRSPVSRGTLVVVVTAVFALVYIYELILAISNVVGVTANLNSANELLANFDQPLIAIPWGLLIADLLLSPLIFAIAFVLARRRTLLVRVVLFAVGLAVVGATTLSVEAIVRSI